MSEGGTSDLIRRYTAQWGLPVLACGHGAEDLILKDGRYICSFCGDQDKSEPVTTAPLMCEADERMMG